MVRASVSFVVLALASASAACTVLSGVDNLEVRSGPPVNTPDATPSTADDAGSSDAATGGSTDASPLPCATDIECQEERCQKDLPDSRLNAQVGKSLGVTATCTAGPSRIVNPGPAHYLAADVRCTLSPQPSPAQVSGFDAAMRADGWYGWSVKTEGSAQIVVGQSTTRECRSY